jgi:hypothetical protein
LVANRGNKSSVLFLDDLILPLVDPVQINLIEAEIARRGRIVPVPIRSEIEMGLARHDYMHSAALNVCNGEPIRRIQARLRRDERPDASARVWRSRLRNGKLRGGK